jgi:MOSC domain-containing protein YiiM
MDSYRYWERELKRTDITFGQFGENFTVEGLADDEVCVGDRYRIGRALFEVTQPRVTCYRVGIRMDEPRMASLLVAHQRSGFYFRVLEEGEVGAGDEIVRVAQGPERMTVTAINALLYLPGPGKGDIERALRIPALSPGWKDSFEALLRQTAQSGPHTGNPALASPEQLVTATPGFRPLKVARMDRESRSVVSLVLEPVDGRRLTVPLPGQFIVLRLRPQADAPPVLRSYSLSGLPDAARFRITIKEEPLMLKLIPAKLRFHDLRHTVASILLSQGQSVRAVSQRLGHSNPALTLRVYAHCMPSDDPQLAETLNKMLG